MRTTLLRFFSCSSRFGTFVLAALLTFTISTGSATEEKYSDSWGKQGLSLNQQSADGVRLNFSIQQFEFTDVNVDGQQMTGIQFSESFLPNEEGAPDLPGFGRYIAVPKGATPVLEIVNVRTEHFSNLNIVPAPRIPLETDASPLSYVKNPLIYARDAFYPAQPVALSEISQIRGLDVVMLAIHPYQYNPVTGELIVYRDIEVNVRFEGGSRSFGEDRYRNRWWDPILEDAVINFATLPKIDYDARTANSSRSTGYEYLIVVPNNPEFSQWADSIKKFRNEQGIYTGVVKLSDIGTNVSAAMLESYFNNAFNTWDIPPTAVLLLGDYGQANANANSIISPIWDNYCVSDNIYADVTGNSMPDIIFARITAQNATQLESMVGRFMKYERTPPTSASFYANPITALGWQTERWFQICSETVGGFWKNVLGKTPVRINEVYQGNPNVDPWSTATNTATVLGVFGPNGLGYIPSSPTALGGWTGGNSTAINNALNAGSFMLMHRDHGMETGWGEPSYTNGSINGLTNTDLSFILSINCLTGKYNWTSECFTEKFHRYTYNNQPAGALGLIAASETSYSFVNDTYVWGMMDNMWPNFMPQYGCNPASRGVLPAFGNAAGKYFLMQSNWPYNTGNKEVTYNLFHMHGDAFLTVCTEVPQNISATYSPTMFESETVFTITASPNALVCLSADGVILGTGTTGFINTIDITIPPQTSGTMIKVTITRPNCNRYEGWVEVIPSVTAAAAGDDATVCEGTAYQLNGQASNYTSLLWETSGTGSFSDATILDPVYTPSSEDITMGAVVLSLTASNPAVGDSTDYMTLSLRLAPVVFAGNAAEICNGSGYSATEATAENYTTMEWATSGTGTFDDPASLSPRYTPSTDDNAAGSVTLSLSAWNDVCDPVVSTIELTIRPLPEPVVSGADQACQNQTGLVYQAATTENTYFWAITGGTITNGQNTAAATVTWDQAGEGSIVLTETNEFGCSQDAGYLVTINAAPAPSVDGMALVCANSSQVEYTAPLVDGDTYAWSVTGGTITAGAGTNAVLVDWAGNGQGMLTLVQTNTATCAGSVEYNVAINSPVISLGNDTTICITHLLNLTVDGEYASYLWSDGSTGSSLLINAQNQGINAATYGVTVADANGCAGESSILVTVDACAGIPENDNSGFTLYPNPNNGEFNLSITDTRATNAVVTIATLTDKIVYSGNIALTGGIHTEKMALNLQSGVYILKVETTSGTTARKLVIR